jgi:hypothetical protein
MSEPWKANRVIRIGRELILIVFGALLTLPSAVAADDTASHSEQAHTFTEHLVLLPGERILIGTVQAVAGGMVQVNTGDLEPRFLPIKGAIEKGIWSLKKGDRLEIAISAENLVVDYHPVDQPGWHRVIKGRLAQPLAVGYEWAVIRIEDGKEEAYAVRPLARIKVAAMPIGVPALFLVGEANKILDATFGDDAFLQKSIEEWKRSVPKAAQTRVEGIVVKPVNSITIRTGDGQERLYELRSFVYDKLAAVPQGARVTLLLDEEGKVTDLAFAPGQKK